MAETSEVTPLILGDDEKVGALDTFDRVLVTSAQLREGMVLVDDLGCACAVLDHRCGPGPRGSGTVRWLIEDLDQHKWREQLFPTTRVATIPVGVR